MVGVPLRPVKTFDGVVKREEALDVANPVAHLKAIAETTSTESLHEHAQAPLGDCGGRSVSLRSTTAGGAACGGAAPSGGEFRYFSANTGNGGGCTHPCVIMQGANLLSVKGTLI